MAEKTLNVFGRLAFGVLGLGTAAIGLVLIARLLPLARRSGLVAIEATAIFVIMMGSATLIRGAMRGRIPVRRTRFSRR